SPLTTELALFSRSVSPVESHVQSINEAPRPEAEVSGRPPQGAGSVGEPPLGAWMSNGQRRFPIARRRPPRTHSTKAVPARGTRGEGTPDRSKLFGSHGQRPWFHEVMRSRKKPGMAKWTGDTDPWRLVREVK